MSARTQIRTCSGGRKPRPPTSGFRLRNTSGECSRMISVSRSPRPTYRSCSTWWTKVRRPTSHVIKTSWSGRPSGRNSCARPAARQFGADASRRVHVERLRRLIDVVCGDCCARPGQRAGQGPPLWSHRARNQRSRPSRNLVVAEESVSPDCGGAFLGAHSRGWRARRNHNQGRSRSCVVDWPSLPRPGFFNRRPHQLCCHGASRPHSGGDLR
jgi:hypothetical protein